MKQTVEVAIEYAGSVISSFGTNGVPNGISAIKEMIASGFKSGAEWERAEAINAHWKSCPKLTKDNDRMCNHSFDCNQNCEYMRSCH